MKLAEALSIIKQALDLSMSKGTCQNLDSAAILAQAWQVLTSEVKEKLNNDK